MTNYRDNEELHLALRKQQDGSRALEIRDAEGNSISRTTLGAQSDSPSFTGDPNAPTANQGDDDLSVATTHFVKRAIDAQHVFDNGSYADLAAAQRTYQRPRPVVQTMVSTMQTGHGWTAINSGVASSNLNDTTDYALGTQSARITTNATGGNSSFEKTGLSVDMTGKSLVLWLQVTGFSALNYIQINLADSTYANRYTAQIMNAAAYSEAQRHVKDGEWLRFTIPFGDFTTITGTPARNTVQRIRIDVVDTNGGAGLTVRLGGVATVPEPATAFPNGVVSFTFDDSYAAHWSVAKPKLDTYGWAGTAFPIIESVGGSGSVTLAQLQAMQNLSGWEVGGHASTVAAHTTDLTGMTQTQRQAELTTVAAWMRTNGFRSDSFAYPSGRFDLATIADTKRVFASARTVYFRTHETYPATDILRLRAVNPSTLTLTQMQTEVDNAVTGRAWLVFILHDLVATKSKTNDVLSSDFQTLVDYVNTKGCAVLPVGDVLRASA